MEHRIIPTTWYRTSGPNEPAYRVGAGETVIVSTVDARGYDCKGVPIPEEARQKCTGTVLNPSNPLIGPFYIEDADLGDTLVVTIDRINLNRSRAWSRILPNFGSFTEEAPGRRLLLNDSIEERFYLWKIDQKRAVATLRPRGE